MATFLETLGVLEFFAPIFSAVLIFAVVFALLIKTRVLGDGKVIPGLIAVVLGILVLIVPDLVDLINFVAPWFVIMFVFLVLMLVVYRMFGLSEGDIGDYFRTDKGVNWAIFAVGLIIIFAGIFSVYGQRALETTQSDDGVENDEFQSNLFDIIFSPQLLGLILVFAVAVFTIGFLGGEGP